jgi:segregation and condensation protein A
MAELTPLEAVTTHDRGIEILVELAKNGQIDPWHIDVVDVTDKYLKTLDVTKEADLRLSGRCLFYAAVLLRLKGEALAEEEAAEEPDLEVDYEIDEEAEEMIIRPAVHVLDQAIARRTSAKQPRTRPTTLVELIAELQRLEEQERERAMSSDNAMRRHRATPEEQRQAVIQMTHEEDLEGDIDRLTILLSEWLTSTGTVLLSDVLAQCPDPRGAFLALLFLDSRGKIALEQPAFYDEILILPEELHAQERAA